MILSLRHWKERRLPPLQRPVFPNPRTATSASHCRDHAERHSHSCRRRTREHCPNFSTIGYRNPEFGPVMCDHGSCGYDGRHFCQPLPPAPGTRDSQSHRWNEKYAVRLIERGVWPHRSIRWDSGIKFRGDLIMVNCSFLFDLPWYFQTSILPLAWSLTVIGAILTGLLTTYRLLGFPPAYSSSRIILFGSNLLEP